MLISGRRRPIPFPPRCVTCFATRFWGRLAILILTALSLASFAAAAEPITLRFVVFEGDEGLSAMRKLLPRFEAENPGVKVHLENAD